jgi:DNA-binding response OmpR family regulator
MMSDKIRVLIVEDHAALAANLFEFLGEQRYVLDFAADGLTALHLVAINHYDVIVLDVMLPGLTGFELCQRIRHDLRCATPLILMTAKDQIDDKINGFSKGADDYLVKPFHLRELALRIEALHRRHRGVESALHAADVSFDPGTLKVQVGTDTPRLELSGTAARIFEALIRAYPRFIAYEQLHETLWEGRDSDMNTLRTHIYALRKLLQDAFGIPLIKTLHGRGYRLVPPGED